MRKNLFSEFELTELENLEIQGGLSSPDMTFTKCIIQTCSNSGCTHTSCLYPTCSNGNCTTQTGCTITDRNCGAAEVSCGALQEMC